MSARGATSAGLYNAVKRGIGIKIVSDKARNAKGYGFQAIMVRTDLMDSGKVKSLKDFKGLKVAMSANGNSENAFMNYALTQNGLTYNDIDPVFLGFPEHIPAFANKAIDASLTVEPTVTKLLSLGSAKKLVGADDVFPDYQTAVVFYSPKFAQDQPDNAKKFMVALVKAMRFYNDALKDGHIAGPNADQVIKDPHRIFLHQGPGGAPRHRLAGGRSRRQARHAVAADGLAILRRHQADRRFGEGR